MVRADALRLWGSERVCTSVFAPRRAKHLQVWKDPILAFQNPSLKRENLKIFKCRQTPFDKSRKNVFFRRRTCQGKFQSKVPRTFDTGKAEKGQRKFMDVRGST